MADKFKRTIIKAHVGYASSAMLKTYNQFEYFMPQPAPIYDVTAIVKNKLENNSQQIVTDFKIQDDDPVKSTLNYFKVFGANPSNYLQPPIDNLGNEIPGIGRKLSMVVKEEYESTQSGSAPLTIDRNIWYIENVGIMVDERNPAAEVGSQVILNHKYDSWTFLPPGNIAPRAGGTGGTGGTGGRRGGRRGGGYVTDDEFPIEFTRPRRKGQKIKNIQEKLASFTNSEGGTPYKDLLSRGSSQFGGTQTQWSNLTDGVYGPRTKAAILAFIKKEKSGSPAFNGDITQEVYDAIIKHTGNVSAKSSDVAAADTKREVAESISYQKDLLNPTKNRHKEVEKLIFERLVKGCK